MFPEAIGYGLGRCQAGCGRKRAGFEYPRSGRAKYPSAGCQGTVESIYCDGYLCGHCSQREYTEGFFWRVRAIEQGIPVAEIEALAPYETPAEYE